jgi:tape measure domain-containing protein
MAEESAGKISYTVDVETQKLLDGSNALNKSLDGLQRQFDKTDGTAKSTGKAFNEAAMQAKPLVTEIRRANAEASIGAGIFQKFGAVLGGFTALGAAQVLIQMAESYGEMSERIQMATSSQAEFEMVQERLLASANETYRSLKQTQELYILTASSLRAMGYDTNQALQVTESLTLAFVKNATSVARADNAISAFSKSLSKGKVEADSWESIIVAIPSIADDIAVALGKSSTEIRRMGAEGKLTADQLTTGLRASLDENRKAAADMAVTVKDAYTRLMNNLSVFIGEANKANGATAVLSSALQAVGKNIETIANILISVGAAALAAYVTKLTLMTVESVKAAVQARALAVAELDKAKAHAVATAAAVNQATAYAALGVGQARLTTATQAHTAALLAQTTAQRGVASAGSLMLGVLGGPVGIIALVAAAATGLYLFRDSASEAAPAVDDLAKSVADLNKEQVDLFTLQATENIAKFSKEAEEAKKRIDDINEGRVFGSAEWINKQLVEAAYNFRVASDNADKYRQRLAELNTYQQKAADSANEPTVTTTAEGQKRLEEMRQEVELLKLTGEARARLQAVQRLGSEATAEEIAQAQSLASQIYQLNEAEKARNKTTKENTKDTEANAKAVKDLENDLALLGKSGLELAQIRALQRLNEFATPEEIARVRQLTAAIYEQNQAAENKARAQQLDPAMGAQASFDKDMEDLRKLNEAKIIEDERYLQLKAQLEGEYNQRMMQIEEERFAAQSRANQLLIDSLNEVQAAGTNAIVGLLSGTNNLTEAFQQLGAGILHHAVGALVEMGISYVKSMVMGQAAQTAAAATAAATGAAMASSYAPAAAMASLASFGANAAPASAGIASTVGLAQALSVSGGRLYGGPTTPGNLYRVNENGAPEIFSAANGKQYMMPNTRGEVISNRDAVGGAGNMYNIAINVDSAGGTTVTESGGSADDAKSLAFAIKAVVIAEIEKQTRQGGMIRNFVKNGSV